jgi:hypothetical protein
MHEIRYRQLLIAHAHHVVVKPGLVNRRKAAVIERLDIDPGNLDPDLRPQQANFHRSLLPNPMA